MPEENGFKGEQDQPRKKIKLLSNYPGALLTFVVTGIFWWFLAVLVLPVHNKMLADMTEEHVGKIIDGIYTSLQSLYSVSSWMVDYAWLLPIIFIAPIIFFERFCKEPQEICLKKQKIVMYSLNSVFILFTAFSYALSCLIVVYFPVQM